MVWQLWQPWQAPSSPVRKANCDKYHQGGLLTGWPWLSPHSSASLPPVSLWLRWADILLWFLHSYAMKVIKLIANPNPKIFFPLVSPWLKWYETWNRVSKNRFADQFFYRTRVLFLNKCLVFRLGPLWQKCSCRWPPFNTPPLPPLWPQVLPIQPIPGDLHCKQGILISSPNRC